MANEFIIKNGFYSNGNSAVTGSLIVSASVTGNDLQVGTNKLVVSASGNVGIGTTTPTKPLVINTSAHDPILINNNNTGSFNRIIFQKPAQTWSVGPNNDNAFSIGDESAGVYRLTITSGTADWNINTNGTGSIGIGVAGVPSAKVHINNRSAGNSFLVEDETNPDTTPFVINTSGSVGIGTLTPTAKLDVNGDYKFGPVNGVTFGNYEWGTDMDASGFTTPYARAHRIKTPDPNNSVFFGIHGSGSVLYKSFWTLDTSGSNSFYASTKGIHLSSSGNVGIGTTAPAVRLDVVTTESQSLRLSATGTAGLRNTLEFFSPPTDTTSATRAGAIYSIYDGVSYTNARLSFQSMTTGNVLVDTMHLKNGNVGIGIQTPTARLHINHTGSGNSFLVEDETNPDTTPFVIDSSGSVGIGTTTPSASLHIKPPAPTTSGQSGVIVEANAGTGINLISDNYNTNQSVTTFGRLQSSMAAFLAYAVNQTGSNTTAYQSSQDAFATKPTALELGNGYFALKYNTSSISRTYGTTVPMATSLYLDGSSGRLGIGTQTPQGILHISSSGYGNETYPFIVGFNQLVVSSSGNVGIGTTTPTAKLDVNGSYRFGPTTNGSVYFRNWDYGTDMDISSVNIGGWARAHRITTSNVSSSIFFGVLGDTTSVTRAYWTVGDPNNGSNLAGHAHNTGIHLSSSGNVGIGIQTPTARLHINHTGSGNSFLVEDSANPDTTPFVIDSSGSVGIGTTTPTSKLHLYHDTYQLLLIERSGSFNAPIQYTNASGLFYAGLSSNAKFTIGTNPDLTNATNAHLVISASGNVGIGTTTPNAKFEIKSAAQNNLGGLLLRASGSSNYPALLYETTNEAGVLELYSGSALTTRLFASGNSYFNGGNVGIGKTTPNSKLDVNGDTIITGSLTVTNDFRVLGSASIQYITSSQLNISDNIISVNTITPSIKFGGISVIDSGSSPLRSGSLLFNSEQDEWIYVHQNITGITSSVLLMGPETYGAQGSEIHPTTNRIMKSLNDEHIGDSNISDNGSIVAINSNTQITGSLYTQTNAGTNAIIQKTSYTLTTGLDVAGALTKHYPRDISYVASGSTAASIGAIKSGTILNAQEHWGYNGSAYKLGGLTFFRATGDWTSTSNPTQWSVNTISSGSTTPFARLYIDDQGVVGTEYLEVGVRIDVPDLNVYNTGSFGSAVRIAKTDGTTNGALDVVGATIITGSITIGAPTNTNLHNTGFVYGNDNYLGNQAYSSILGGESNTIDTGGTRNVILGGYNNSIVGSGANGGHSDSAIIGGSLNNIDAGAPADSELIAVSFSSSILDANRVAIIACDESIINKGNNIAIVASYKSTNTFPFTAGHSAIIGGSYNRLGDASNSVILGGSNITASFNNTVYMPNAKIIGSLTVSASTESFPGHTIDSYDFDINQSPMMSGNVFRVKLWDNTSDTTVPVIDAGGYKLNTINSDGSGNPLTSIDWNNRRLYDSNGNPGGPSVVLDWYTAKTVKVSGSLLVSGSIGSNSGTIDMDAMIQASLLYLSNNF